MARGHVEYAGGLGAQSGANSSARSAVQQTLNYLFERPDAKCSSTFSRSQEAKQKEGSR